MAINQTKQNINIKSAPQMQKLQIWGGIFQPQQQKNLFDIYTEVSKSKTT